MGGGFQFVEIIILALVAAFIALRLRSVLGRGGGHKRPSGAGAKNPELDNEAAPRVIEGELLERSWRDGGTYKTLPDKMKISIDAIMRGDREFNLDNFLEGAKKAYAMILEGFWSGNKKTVEPFLSEAVRQQFFGVVDDREEKGLTVENKLLNINQVNLKDALVESGRAELTVEFISEIIAVTKDRFGKLVEGDLSDSVEVTDIWTFARQIGSRDPNWVLVATRAG